MGQLIIYARIFRPDDTSYYDNANFQEYFDVYIDDTLVEQQSGFPLTKGQTYEFKVVMKTVDFYRGNVKMESRQYNLRDSGDGKTYTYTGEVVLRFGNEVDINISAYEREGATVVEVNAPKPTQDKNTITIPSVDHVIYKNVNTGETVEGQIELTEDTTIKPEAVNNTDGFEYVIKNPEEWLFIYKTLVEAPKPSFVDNVLTIPVIEGVEYVDSSNTVVSGEWFLEEDTIITVIKAVEDDSYILVNEEQSWTFNYEGGIRVYADEPVIDQNVIIIPQIEGVGYYFKVSGERITQETVNIFKDVVLYAKALPGYRLMNPGIDYAYEFKNYVIAPKPEMKVNTITIPVIPGTEYFNDWNEETRKETITGKIRLSKHGRPNISISARAKEGFVLENQNERWNYEYVKNKADLSILRPDSAFDTNKDRHIVKIDGEVIPKEDQNILVPVRRELTFEITIVDDSTFAERPHLVIGGTQYTFGLSEDETRATLKHTFPEEQVVVLQTGALNRELRDFTFVGDNTTLKINFGVGEPKLSLRDGDTVRLETWNNYSFELEADPGYVFEEYGEMKHGEDISDISLRVGNTPTTTARTSINRFLHDTVITMHAVFQEPETPSDVLGFNHLYLTDKDKLGDISLDIFRRRHSYIDTEPGTPLPERFDPYIATDPHTYIINTIQLPFKIPEDLIGTEQSIQLGFTQLVPRAPTIIKDKISIDLGSIYTPKKHNNSYDYKGTDILIHLPYMNPVSVDPNYVIDETIFIRYIVDLYTGETTVNLLSSKTNNKVFYSSTTLIGNEVPFVAVKDATIIGNLQSSRTVIQNNTPVPYIEVVRNKSHQMDSRFNKDIKTTVDNLLNTKGHIYVHDIDLDLDTTLDELTTVKSILSSGIIIK